MRVRVYATKPDGYWWKAPSWSDGRRFELGTGVELDLSDDDMAALSEHVQQGYWLRYQEVQKPAPVAVAEEPKKKK